MPIVDPEQVVGKFFANAGMKPGLSIDDFWKKATRLDRVNAEQFRKTIARGSDDIGRAHRLVNSSLDFANLALSHFELEKLRAAALFLLQGKTPAAGRVLELGCDSGLLLCLLASCLPDVQFTGLDICKEAVRLAQERAERFDLRNISFRVGNVARGFASTAGGKYDMVLSVTVFHEVLAERQRAASHYEEYSPFTFEPPPPKPALAVDELDRQVTAQVSQHASLASLPKVLAEDGTFVSIERWPSIREKLQWIRKVEAHGLHASLSDSGHIRFESENSDGARMSERLPVTTFKKTATSWNGAFDVLAFCSDFNRSSVNKYLDSTAELLYSALHKDVACSYVAECLQYEAPSTLEFGEIGVASSLAYVYSTTSDDYRSLQLVPRFAFGEYARAAVEEFSKGISFNNSLITTRNEPLMAELGLRIENPTPKAAEPEDDVEGMG